MTQFQSSYISRYPESGLIVLTVVQQNLVLKLQEDGTYLPLEIVRPGKEISLQATMDALRKRVSMDLRDVIESKKRRDQIAKMAILLKEFGSQEQAARIEEMMEGKSVEKMDAEHQFIVSSLRQLELDVLELIMELKLTVCAIPEGTSCSCGNCNPEGTPYREETKVVSDLESNDMLANIFRGKLPAPKDEPKDSPEGE